MVTIIKLTHSKPQNTKLFHTCKRHEHFNQDFEFTSFLVIIPQIKQPIKFWKIEPCNFKSTQRSCQSCIRLPWQRVKQDEQIFFNALSRKWCNEFGSFKLRPQDSNCIRNPRCSLLSSDINNVLYHARESCIRPLDYPICSMHYANYICHSMLHSETWDKNGICQSEESRMSKPLYTMAIEISNTLWHMIWSSKMLGNVHVYVSLCFVQIHCARCM